MLASQKASPRSVGLASTRTMTIEARTAVYGGNGVQQPRRDSSSSNGCQESPSEDDGYFTSAVSVQHKVSENLGQITSYVFLVLTHIPLKYVDFGLFSGA